VHEHDLALTGRKYVHGIPHQPQQLSSFEALVDQRLFEEVCLESAATKPHLGQVHGDSAQPRGEARRISELRETEVRTQQRLLHEVFRLLTDHSVDDRFDAGPIALHKFGECRRVAGKRGSDELVIPHVNQ
jgi:hypothetical protein